MSAIAQLSLDLPPTALQWTTPKGRGKCSRDPAAGPGTCWLWWEGCPKAEKRDCFLLAKQRAAAKAKIGSEQQS
ncbi:hypothetical protein BA190_27675 [Labrys sp. WJW]|uniref:hypothetical protein n=1 Tax=Labrys sp. WJW TaxID=1737983 RepID=UPI000834216A|nr:hypothetical protein [Labrys sp. WJW]OCC01744.1 hypothetical protein BA190_27675 [Labrys sp. WJW]